MHFKALTLAALAGTAFSQGLVSTLQSTPQLSNLTTYLSLFPNLVNQLSSLTNITLLAPSNAAFAAFLNSSSGGAIANNQTDLIQAIFTYHVLNGSYPSINQTAFIPTALQPPQFANVTGGQRVEAVPGKNGSVTFFSGLLANSTVTAGPLNFTGGVIHIVDKVLTIPQNISETAVQLNLTSIVGALKAANLAGAVDGLRDVTVFVPNNAAFQAIGSALPNLTTQQVTSILTYHVINGTVGYSTGLKNGSTLTTLQGTNVTVRINSDKSVFVNDARVVIPNVLVANGVVHVIDNVLNPMNTAANSTGTAGTPAFSGASSASNVPFTSGVPTPTAPVATSAVASTRSAAATSTAGAMPMKTGAVGAAALFGGAALVMNI